MTKKKKKKRKRKISKREQVKEVKMQPSNSDYSEMQNMITC